MQVNYRYQAPTVVKNIIILNVVFLVVTYFARPFMMEHFSLFYPASPFFKPFQLVSHMFMHANFIHLLFNMYTLYIFGTVLEHVWGSKRFLLYYFVTGLGAACLHLFVMWLQARGLAADIAQGQMHAFERYQVLLGTPTVGASGAVYGVLLGYGMLFPNTVMQLIFPPVALKAKYFVLIFGALELILGLSNSGGNIAHFAHLGGMLFGFLLILYWRKRNRTYF